MNGAENGAGVSGNAERGIPGNKDMAAYSGDAGGLLSARSVGTVGELLNASKLMEAEYLDFVHFAGGAPTQREGSYRYQN